MKRKVISGLLVLLILVGTVNPMKSEDDDLDEIMKNGPIGMTSIVETEETY